MDHDARPGRRAPSICESLRQSGRTCCQHPRRRGLSPSGDGHLPPTRLSAAACSGYRAESGPSRREKVAKLAIDCSRSDHVLERQLGGRLDGVQEERAGCIEGAERMCYLLFRHLDRHADPEQTVRDLQEHLPFGLSVPVV
jgi:hypothetical protein